MQYLKSVFNKMVDFFLSVDFGNNATKQKGETMDLVKLLNDLVANIAALQVQLADAQASAQALADAKYKEGFDAGVASVQQPPSDKIYSQVELDAALAQAVQPLEQKIADLQAQLDAVPQAIADGVAAVKAELLAKYEEMLVVEQNAETGFKDLLK